MRPSRWVPSACYHRPLTPAELAELWPNGPTSGGDGSPIILSKPSTA